MISVVISFLPENDKKDVYTVLPAVPSIGHVITILGTDDPHRVVEVEWAVDVEDPKNTSVYLVVEPTETHLTQQDGE